MVGIKEVEAYSVVNNHFNKKFEPFLLQLVGGVFADCLLYDLKFAEEDQKSALDKLCEAYPDFAKLFAEPLKQLKTGVKSGAIQAL
jgi:hypothetical protein